MNPEYKETFFLSAGETNAEQELSLAILTARLIEIATAHANSLDIGNPSMTGMHAGWVLSRLTIEMNSYPRVNDNFSITTWIESFNRHFSERAFRIEGENGEVYGYARSVWMVIDTVTHNSVGLGHFNLPENLISGECPPIERQQKHFPILDPDFEGIPPKGAIVAGFPVFDYRFKYCDLDSYRHVNTVRYVTLLLNRFSLEEHDTTFVKRLELSFMHEAKYGMETQLLRHDATPLHSSSLLRRKDDSSPLLFARMLREKR
jgi:acyl-ACP thioesterase